MKDTIALNCGNWDNEYFENFLQIFQRKFIKNIEDKNIFTTNTLGIWEVYLSSFADNERQYYNCRSCQKFIEKFGSLVTIDDTGKISSIFWDEAYAPEIYKPAVRAMRRLVNKGKVNGVFIYSEIEWGTRITGVWKHFAVTPPERIVFSHPLHLLAEQIMAEKEHDYNTISRFLREFTKEDVRQALLLLQSNSLYRSEKVLGQAQWLYDLYSARETTKNIIEKNNLTWKAVAAAPAGFCHPRSSMVGTLLDDIVSGLSISEISRKFNEKMSPTKYQRPQVLPTEGNIKRAEEIVSKLGIASSFRRRFARVDELQCMWKPEQLKVESEEGIFSHLKSNNSIKQGVNNFNIPTVTMTWSKFSREIIPSALEIEYYVNRGKSSFAAFVTAVDQSAPPIIQWDNINCRNPVSWYTWNGGSFPEQWKLTSEEFYKVSAVVLLPSMWNGDNEKLAHYEKGAMFILDGARETKAGGLGLFPEILKSDLREIRSTIESYSKAGKLEEASGDPACGVLHSNSWNCYLVVRSKLGKVGYKIDRWD